MIAPNSDVLVVNAGSTSIKLSVVDERGDSAPVGSLEKAPAVAAVGHRIVHGGERFTTPVRLDDEVIAELERLVELAPLHNAPAVDAIRAALSALPDIPQVGVFDTAFHGTLPEVTRTYLLPARFRERGIRRFGFHGLSVQWASERVPAPRLVVCHLGGGSSVTAVQEGRSVDTTMGFTPLEGVPMATRAGSVDPGALLYLLRKGVTLEELESALERESGLTGIAGTGDVARLEREGSPESELALAVYCYRVGQAVAAMAVALGGLDALVFTGGVGENSARVRTAVCAQLNFLGIAADDDTNLKGAGETVVSSARSAVRVVVVPAREDLVIARAVRSVLST
jgi:acetate kinase